MKLTMNNEELTAYRKKLYEWSPVFLWFPARMETGELRWLEVVDRRTFTSSGLKYSYYRSRHEP